VDFNLLVPFVQQTANTRREHTSLWFVRRHAVEQTLGQAKAKMHPKCLFYRVVGRGSRRQTTLFALSSFIFLGHPQSAVARLSHHPSYPLSFTFSDSLF
jgi:hypothetical protein